jgi:hypothetical protein
MTRSAVKLQTGRTSPSRRAVYCLQPNCEEREPMTESSVVVAGTIVNLY